MSLNNCYQQTVIHTKRENCYQTVSCTRTIVKLSCSGVDFLLILNLGGRVYSRSKRNWSELPRCRNSPVRPIRSTRLSQSFASSLPSHPVHGTDCSLLLKVLRRLGSIHKLREVFPGWKSVQYLPTVNS